MIGRTLSHFRILAKISEGGMGVVYRAEDTKLRRQVALKVLPPDLVANEERRLRFLREARAAAAVTHPNIGTIYEVDEADGVVFIAMELVEGKTLREQIGGRPMPIKDALRIATEMAEGLAEAHKAGVIHRDLKPDNVIVHSNGHPKILDFGLAKLLDERAGSGDVAASKMETISGELTREGKIFGTALYMSPEQARGKQVDARSDIFSFGTTLYEMVTGKVPFQGKTSTDILSAITRDTPTPPSQQNAEVSPKLEEIITECLEKDPGERYQHADQVAVDLRKLRRVTDSGVQAVRTPSGPMAVAPSSGWTRLIGKGTRRTALVATLGVLLIVAGVAIWWTTQLTGGFESGDHVLVVDFENTSDRLGLGPAVRDAFENMLAASRFIDVIRGERLKELLAGHGSNVASKIDHELANRLCIKGRCSGFLTGRISPDDSGYRIEAELYRGGEKSPVISRSSGPHPEEELLMATHALVLDLRQALGEAPGLVASTAPPTTRSLRAYQAFASAHRSRWPDEMAGLYRRALEIDPEFIHARWGLAYALWNLGDYRRYREVIKEVYLGSSVLPEEDRLRAEIDFLDASYDFDTEIERLKAAMRLYPLKDWPHKAFCILYPTGYQDIRLADTSCREAYRLNPGDINFGNRCLNLVSQGKASEIERVVADFRTKTGLHTDSDLMLLWAYMIRGEEEKIRQTVDLLQGKLPRLSAHATNYFLTWLLVTGRLAEAWKVVPEARRAGETAATEKYKYLSSLRLAWLTMRRTGSASVLSAESVRPSVGYLTELPRFATFSVDTLQAEPLAQLLHEHELAEKDSKSRFVREELEFARGCLALIGGEAQKAREILEPVARTSNLVRRHRMLGRAYEGLGLLREAADEYERVLQNPHLKWDRKDDFLVPAVQVLEQFRLARIYERLNDTDRARHWYERFLADWKDADPDIPELIEAKKRLAALSEVEAVAS